MAITWVHKAPFGANTLASTTVDLSGIPGGSLVVIHFWCGTPRTTTSPGWKILKQYATGGPAFWYKRIGPNEPNPVFTGLNQLVTYWVSYFSGNDPLTLFDLGNVVSTRASTTSWGPETRTATVESPLAIVFASGGNSIFNQTLSISDGSWTFWNSHIYNGGTGKRSNQTAWYKQLSGLESFSVSGTASASSSLFWASYLVAPERPSTNPLQLMGVG